MINKAKLTLVAVLGFASVAIVAASGIASPALAQSPSYPWCVQASTYRCWYMNREQCEEAVDYRGFCVTDPNVPRRYGERVRGE